MKFRAPCGHVGEPIIGTYVACRSGCEGPPRRCGRCGSERIEPFSGYGAPRGSVHCAPCGWVFWRPGM